MSIKNESFITVQGWMRNELNLKGNDLLVYAIIYGFSQTENQKFTGSLQYLADWCGATKQGILKNIKNLLDAGLIQKDSASYYTTEFNAKYDTVKLSLTDKCEDVKLSLINNIDNNKNIEFNKIKPVQKPKQSLYDKCVNLIDDFTDDVILRELLVHALRLFLENSKESGAPFYTNTFKGKLNKLKELSISEGIFNNYTARKIVKQTIDNGWNGFYELKSNKSTKSNSASDAGRTAKRMTAEEKKQFKEDIASGKLEKF